MYYKYSKTNVSELSKQLKMLAKRSELEFNEVNFSKEQMEMELLKATKKSEKLEIDKLIKKYIEVHMYEIRKQDRVRNVLVGVLHGNETVEIKAYNSKYKGKAGLAVMGGILMVVAGPFMATIGALNVLFAGASAHSQKNLNDNIDKIINELFEKEKIQPV